MGSAGAIEPRRSSTTPPYESLSMLLLQLRSYPSHLDDNDYDSNAESHNDNPHDINDDEENLRFSNVKWRRRFVSALCVSSVAIGILMIFIMGNHLQSDDSTFTTATASSIKRATSTIRSTTKSSPWNTLSPLLGFSYFLCWTVSFYPQLITNCRNLRMAKPGLSLDFFVLNIFGYACYALYTTFFRYNHFVREEYAEKFGDKDIADDRVTGVDDNYFSLEQSLILPWSLHAQTKVDIVAVGVGALWNGMLSSLFSIQSSLESEYSHSISAKNDVSKGIIQLEPSYSDNNNGKHKHKEDAAVVFTENMTLHFNSSTTGTVPVPQVKVEDVIFAWHALLLSTITFLQIVCFTDAGSYENIETDENSIHDADDELFYSELNANNSTNASNVNVDYNYSNRNDTWTRTKCEKEKELSTIAHSLYTPNDISHLSIQRKSIKERYQQQKQSKPELHFRLQETPQHCAHHLWWIHRVSCTTNYSLLLLIILSIVGVPLVAASEARKALLKWIDYFYFLSFIKVGITAVKYIPQVILNYQRKSTTDWQILATLLDFSGGILSTLQLFGDSLVEARAQGLPFWTGVMGNPAKLLLGLLSIAYDIVLMIQHYALYPHPSLQEEMNNNQALASKTDTEFSLLLRRIR